MLIAIHMLKNYAPSNLNRDDIGSPKSCIFGEEIRGRISSQCLKRSIRESPILRSAFSQAMFGVRTQKLSELVRNELAIQNFSEEFLQCAIKKVTGFGNKVGTESDDLKTAQLMFFSQEDVKAVVRCLISAYEANGKDIKKFENINANKLDKQIIDICRPLTLDIALFGRMSTSDAFRNVDSAMQVAHAISANRLERESDYFAALDDLTKNNGLSKAAMIGDTEFNSNYFYHYFSLDLDQLIDNLKYVEDKKEIVIKLVPTLLRVIAYVSPSGKQNSFAAHQLPSVIYVEIKKEKIPVSYANGFIEPASAGWKSKGSPRKKISLIEDANNKFIEEINRIQQKYDIEVKNRMWFSIYDNLVIPNNSDSYEKFSDLRNVIESIIREMI